MSDEKTVPREPDPAILAALQDADLAPQFIYAYKNTGFVVFAGDEQSLPAGARELWDAAIEEYFELEEQAGDGQRN